MFSHAHPLSLMDSIGMEEVSISLERYLSGFNRCWTNQMMLPLDIICTSINHLEFVKLRSSSLEGGGDVTVELVLFVYYSIFR